MSGLLIAGIGFVLIGASMLLLPRLSWEAYQIWNELWGYRVETEEDRRRVLYTRMFGVCSLAIGVIAIWVVRTS